MKFNFCNGKKYFLSFFFWSVVIWELELDFFIVLIVVFVLLGNRFLVVNFFLDD